MTIYVGVDGSEGAAEALRFAAREGELRKLPVTAIVAWDLLSQKSLTPDGEFDPHYDEKDALAVLDAWVVAAVGSDAATRVERQSIVDIPWHALVDVSAGADLLVVGARGTGGFLGLRIGSVSEHCLYHAKCPVAVVHAQERASVPSAELIVVGVDGSESSLGALAWALDEARARGAQVRAISAWTMPVLTYPTGGAIDSGTFESAGKEILTDALAGSDVHGLEGKIDTHVAPGGPAAAILDAARDATLVVVGSRGLSHAKEIVFGSVSHQVVHHAPCPVVVVRAAPRGG